MPLSCVFAVFDGQCELSDVSETLHSERHERRPASPAMPWRGMKAELMWRDCLCVPASERVCAEEPGPST